jgi:hypothetical protein
MDQPGIMNAFVILLALSTGIALATAVLSFFALLQVRQVARESRARTREMEGRMQAALKMTDAGVEALTTELHEFERQPALNVSPAVPRSAFNMAKRTQALRMHRQGDSPEKIATSLELPLQEIELLLKVHRIVLSSI